jgi:hypothetical protein
MKYLSIRRKGKCPRLREHCDYHKTPDVTVSAIPEACAQPTPKCRLIIALISSGSYVSVPAGTSITVVIRAVMAVWFAEGEAPFRVISL